MRGKNRSTRRKTSRSREENQQTQPSYDHLWHQVREWIPGHIGGRRVLSPLRQPCSPRANPAPHNPHVIVTDTHLLVLFSYKTDTHLSIPAGSKG